jgi:hypothetical protein
MAATNHLLEVLETAEPAPLSAHVVRSLRVRQTPRRHLHPFQTPRVFAQPRPKAAAEITKLAGLQLRP